MYVQERFHAEPVAVNGTYVNKGNSIGGFIAATAGTITITRSTGVVVLSAVPVTAGVFLPLPMLLGLDATITLGGGASGAIFK